MPIVVMPAGQAVDVGVLPAVMLPPGHLQFGGRKGRVRYISDLHRGRADGTNHHQQQQKQQQHPLFMSNGTCRIDQFHTPA